MSVYNSEKYVGEAIESVLKQTDSNFELLIVDDCSTDNSIDIIESYKDKRIVLFRNAFNQGLTKNLNYLINKSKGKYIARLDADDICEPDRLRKQREYLEQNLNVHMVYSKTSLFGDETGSHKIPQSFDELKVELLFGNPITHSSVMFRKDTDYLYDEIYIKSQDYELWDRFVFNGKVIHGMNEILVHQRIHPEQITKKGISEQEKLTATILFRALKRLNIMLSKEEENSYSNAIRFGRIDNVISWKKQYDILRKIENNNRFLKIYRKRFLKKKIKQQYYCLFKYFIQNASEFSLRARIAITYKTGVYTLIRRWFLKKRVKSV